MNNKIIVWDLFGGGQNSVYQAIGDNPLFEIYTFDLYPKNTIINNMLLICHKI
ncbi:hypothetical protein NWP96_05935 [Mycoplasmopsis cynos]|nr:hypothetical protein [Mycoplasmopsis cynos]